MTDAELFGCDVCGEDKPADRLRELDVCGIGTTACDPCLSTPLREHVGLFPASTSAAVVALYWFRYMLRRNLSAGQLRELVEGLEAQAAGRVEGIAGLPE